MLKNWSLDIKFFLIFFVAMHVLLLAGVTTTVKSQLAAAGGLVAIFTLLSLRNRRNLGWRWPGFKSSGVTSLLMSVLVSAFLVFGIAGMVIPEGQRDVLFKKPFNAGEILLTAWKAITVSHAPFDPRLTPGLLICAGIALFLALAGLQLVTYSQEQFLEQCHADRPPESDNPSPGP